MISTVTGYFKIFSLTVETEGDHFLNASDIELIADIASINTNNEQRDTHLKSEDFLDYVKHGHIIFKGNRFEGNEDEGKIYGELTIRGITKEVIVQVEHGGIVFLMDKGRKNLHLVKLWYSQAFNYMVSQNIAKTI